MFLTKVKRNKKLTIFTSYINLVIYQTTAVKIINFRLIVPFYFSQDKELKSEIKHNPVINMT